MSDMWICGLFEWELVKQGLMKEGRCRDCFYDVSFHENGNTIWDCEKFGQLLDERTDCPDWVIDTR